MTGKTDLYSILISYANKNNSPYIEVDGFLVFFEKYVKKMAAEDSDWLKWDRDREPRFWTELSTLAEEGKCDLLTDTPEGRIYMPHLYLELIGDHYQNIDENSYLPFPSEESLRIKIPESQVFYIGAETGLAAYMQDPPENQQPIIRIGFPDDFGSALTLAEFIPERIAEASLLKVRDYLRNHGNKDYAYHKLTPQFAGKEVSLRNVLDQILTRPLDCFRSIEEGGDFSYLFWAHFGIVAKADIKKKKDKLSEDIAAFQAACILEAISSYYRTLAVKKREREMAFRDLENHLKKPPFMFSLEQIIKFTNSKGVLLLSQYSKEDLELWLKKQTTDSENNELPPLLLLKTGEETWFISKPKMPPLCARLLGETRERVKTAVTRRWVKLLRDYRRESSMDNDKDFEKLLEDYTQKFNSVLAALLDDPKLQIVYDEMEQSNTEIPIAGRIYANGKLLPYSELYLFRRKDILNDALLLLPFWFSMPFLNALLKLFRNLFRKRRGREEFRHDDDEIFDIEPGETARERETYRERYLAAKEIETLIVPSGYTLDGRLEELQGRWSRLIDKQARANLVEDVNSLVRDNLRRTLRVQKKYKVTAENLSQLAASIVSSTPSLRNIGSKDSLILYIELYLIKLIETVRF